MKKAKHLFFITAFILSAVFAKAQAPQNWFSPDRLFDTTIVDNDGKRYTLNDIRVDTISENGSGLKTTLAACTSTSAGYFDLYLQPGCGFEPIPGNPTQSAINAQRLSVLCQLFIDLSNFVTNRGGNSNRVRILIKDFNNIVSFPSTSSAGAKGGSYTALPYSPKGGISDTEIWKTINSGQDSYLGVVSPLVASSATFHHGFLGFNFYNTSLNWHADLSTVPTSTLLDIYTFGLHEMAHALGFGGYVTYNGASASIPVANGSYFTRYDLNLKTQSGLNVITNSGGCSMYNYSINPAFSNPTNILSPGSVSPGCGPLPYTTMSDVTTCSTSIMYSNGSYNVNVYTPNCFEDGSSLNHFEDMCYPTNTPTNNNQYFVMSNIIGGMRRYLKEEERKVLCDIGYTVAANYGSATYTTTQKTYTAGACNGLSVIGVNDGFTGGNYTYTGIVGNSYGPIAPLTNDLGVSSGSFECLEVVIGSGNVSITTGSTFNYTPLSAGLHLLRYVPKNSAGTVKGNITYIYFKAVPNGTACGTPNGCEMVYNGGFENASTTCGASYLSTGAAIDCWDIESLFFRYFIRNCSTSSPINGFSPSFYSIPGVGESWNLFPNNAFVYSQFNAATNRFVMEGKLTASLVPTAQYKASFWVLSHDPTPTIMPDLVINISAASSPVVGPVPASTIIPSPFVSIATFTVPNDGLWHNCSTTFTYNGALPAGNIYAMSLYTPSTNLGSFNLDDISILPASSASTFTLPTISCTGTSYTLNPMVSIPNGTFTGPGVTYSSPNYVFTANSAGLGLKTISYTYTTPTGCTLTAYAQTSVVTTPTAITVLANPPAGLCSSYPTATLTGTGATNYTWNPGALTGSTVSVSPTVTTIYTVTGANTTCSLSTTYTVNYTTSCLCTGASTLASTLSNTIISGGQAVTGNVTVSTGTVIFSAVDMRCSPGVSITVASGATLTITQSHLYSCFDMWQGIDVQPGGYLVVNTSLIEDATQAIKVDNNTSTTGRVLDISSTIFNRNNIGISVSNYTQTASTTYTCFSVKSTIFTSRDFTFTPISWATQGNLSQTCTPTNPLGSPYCLQNFPVTNMKAPNNTTTSYYGITLDNVGVTLNPSLTPTYYSMQIGVPNSTVNFNIFDNLFHGISSYNSNLKVSYNVFQNSQARQIRGNWIGGTAVESSSDDYNNNYLMVKSPAPYTTSRVNKFYDCSYSVKTNNIFEHDIQRNIVQSTQTVSAGYQQGKYGFFVTTNRFKKCDVASNSLLNIENGITFYSTYGWIYFGASSYANTQYANSVNLNTNTISPVISGPIGNNFVSNAITAQDVLGSGTTETVSVGSNILIQSNTIVEAYRGINVSNFYTPPVLITNNNCTMAIDPGGNLQQCIAITTCSNASVQVNSIVGPVSSNTITTGIYASMNNTPKVTCNTVSTTYQGFEFAGSQPGTKWKGNSMTTHTLGFALTYTGVIGAQGSATAAIDNAWNGTWTGSNYNTWTDATSSYLGSTLYMQNTAPYNPTNSNGFIPANSYLFGGTVTATGAYSCVGGGARMMTNDQDYEQAYLKTLEDIANYQVTKGNVLDPSNYIAQYQLYRTLENDFSYYSSSKTLSDFYFNNSSSNYNKLLKSQNDLMNGNYSSATSALNGIGSKNNVENNYSDFATLYGKYYTKNFTDNDNSALKTLANKCPFIEGEVIYQARTFYNVINSTVEVFKDNCPDNSSSRLSQNNLLNNWDVSIYPNPATSELFIRTKNESEALRVQIIDVNGRIVAEYEAKTSSTISNIKLNLTSGVYFVSLINQYSDKVVKKLVINK